MKNASGDAASRFPALINLLASEFPSGNMPVALEGSDLHHALASLNCALPAFLRTLLVADGTVTMAIEAFYAERIEVKTIRQSLEVLPAPFPMLSVADPENVLYREVILRGCESGQVYASAYSLIRESVIAKNLYHELVAKRVGIGTLLRNTAKGSYREILKMRAGGVHGASLKRQDQLILDNSDFGRRDEDGVGSELVSRTYRVFLDGVPGILITEVFPVSPFSNGLA
ncbi:MAG: chorismate-pyruvate lyase [Candidatus Azotimanducaceae bacterium]|jgi:chorismate-pyruvate lyase